MKAGWRVSLPTEVQWEWAARGADRHVYPGGHPLTPDRANFDETGIGTTNAVGCFPGGVSWCGIEELAGNAWEWTRFNYRRYPHRPNDGRKDTEDIEGDAPRVLRGGSFRDSSSKARCAHWQQQGPDSRGFNGCRVVLSPFRS
jgi:formylglycine-generating enzyme required for sulfatase activity